VIAGLPDENSSGDRKGNKGSPGDERPATKKSKSYRNKSQETKPTLGYAQWQKKMMR
jgi:hypothetical protein